MPNEKRAALITGGTSGIGLETARLLAKDGCEIVLFDVDDAGLEQAEESLRELTNVWPFFVDVCDPEQISRAIEHLRESGRTVDVLVNNVGGSTIREHVDEMSDETFDNIIALNLKTVFLCTKAVIPGMKANNWGRIVNVASVAGRTHALSTNSNAAYIAAKAGVIGFTKQCAVELAPFGITVNAVAFGPIATPRVLAGWERRSAENREEFLRSIPVGRFGNPREAAAGIRHFCGDDASYTTGAVLDVNGGLYM